MLIAECCLLNCSLSPNVGGQAAFRFVFLQLLFEVDLLVAAGVGDEVDFRLDGEHHSTGVAAGLGDGRLEAVVARGTGPAVPKYLTVVGAEHGHVLYRNKVGQDSASGIGWIGRIGGDLLSVRADQNGSEVSWVSVVVDGPVLAPNRIGTINDVGERQLRAADDHAAAGGARREHTDAVGVRGGPGVQRFNSIDA